MDVAKIDPRPLNYREALLANTNLTPFWMLVSRGIRKVSKHARKAFEGMVRVFKESSFQKVGRAMRRGMLPPELANKIALAQKTAADRAMKYMNAHARRALADKNLSVVAFASSCSAVPV